MKAKTDERIQNQILSHAFSTMWHSDEKRAKKFLKIKCNAQAVFDFHHKDLLDKKMIKFVDDVLEMKGKKD